MSIRPISFDPLDPTDSPIVPGTETWTLTTESMLDLDYAVLQLSSTYIPPGWTGDLAALQANVVAIIPPRSYIVRLPTENQPLLLALPLVRWVGNFLPGYRVPPDVMEAAFTLEGGELDVMLVLFRGEDPDDYLAILPVLVPGIVIEQVFEPGPESSWTNAHVAVSIPAAQLPGALQALAGLEALQMIDLRVPPTSANDGTVMWLQSGEIDLAVPRDLDTFSPAYRADINGEGETVAVADSGLENDMCFFRWGGRFNQASTTRGQYLRPPLLPLTVNAGNKVVAYYWVTNTGPTYDSDCGGNIIFHGTHVAGTAVGDAFDDAGTVPNWFLAAVDDPASEDEPPSPPGPPQNVLFGFNIDHHQPGDGLAPGAQLLVQDIMAACSIDLGADIADLFQQAYFTPAPGNARHHNNSWGSPPWDYPEPNWMPYDLGNVASDRFAWSHRDFNVYFAAGNSGYEPSRIWANAQMKNCVSVGSSIDPEQPVYNHGFAMNPGSSHGPAVGMRIKPDLAAPGNNISSARPGWAQPETSSTFPPTGDYDCGLGASQGTSMATPAVTGLSALLRQYLREGRYPDGSTTHPETGFSPTSALIKALLVNSTRTLWYTGGGPGTATGNFDLTRGYRPSMGQGWGRPVLDDIIDFGAGDIQGAAHPVTGERERSKLLILTDTPNGLTTLDTNDGRPLVLDTFQVAITQGDIHEFTFDVRATDEPLHVTLAWSDVEAANLATAVLVNDLDLEVIDPIDRVWRPEPGSPLLPPSNPFGIVPSRWENGWSKLDSDSGQPQNSAPPFNEFEGRDERNNVENIFVKTADVLTGTWTARVIFKASAATPAPETLEAYPDLVPVDSSPCIGINGTPCDWADTRDQGYALVASGAIATLIVGEPVVSDGCEEGRVGGEPADGLLDLNELVNLRIPVTTQLARAGVIGCLEALPGSGTEGAVQIGGFANDFGPGVTSTRCAVLGDMDAGATAWARFPIMLDVSHPVPPVETQARFLLRVSGAPPDIECGPLVELGAFPVGVDLDPAAAVLTGYNPSPAQPGKGDCGFPDDPRWILLDGDGDTIVDDLFIEFCPSNPFTFPADTYNIYRGFNDDCTPRLFNHVSFTQAEWCNLPCNDGGFGLLLDPWGNDVSQIDGRCEALLLNQGPLEGSHRYYVISGEKTCAMPGEGAEGPFKTCGTCSEFPFGGGVCP